MEYRHPLTAWRKQTGTTLSELAIRTNSAPSTLSRIERRTCAPTFALAARIIKATGGALDANDFLPPDEERAA